MDTRKIQNYLEKHHTRIDHILIPGDIINDTKDLEKGEELTGVPAADIIKAAEMIHQSKSACITESSAPLGHHTNGMQNYRAMMSLLVITGNFDRKGGQRPLNH